MKKVFINKINKAIIIVSLQNAIEYSMDGSFKEMFEGTHKKCLIYLDEYWEEQAIDFDNRIYQKD